MVVGRSLRDSQFAPDEVLAFAAEQVQTYVHRLQNLGLTFKTRFLVISGTHTQAILRAHEAGIRDGQPLLTPRVDFAGNSELVPNFIRGYQSVAHEPQHPVLFFPVFSLTEHSLDHPFIIAHELAHLTENTPIYDRYQAWSEGRADFIAYLATGISRIDFPQNLNRSSRRFDVLNFRHRRQLTQVSASYHTHSQVISHILLRLEQSLGRATTIEWLNRMDQIITSAGDNRRLSASRQVQKFVRRFKQWGRLLIAEEQQKLEPLLLDLERLGF